MAYVKRKQPVLGVGWGSKTQAANYIDVSDKVIDNMISAGLPVAKFGGCIRIKYADVDSFLEKFKLGDDPLGDMVDQAQEMLNSLR